MTKVPGRKNATIGETSSILRKSPLTRISSLQNPRAKEWSGRFWSNDIFHLLQQYILFDLPDYPVVLRFQKFLTNSELSVLCRSVDRCGFSLLHRRKITSLMNDRSRSHRWVSVLITPVFLLFVWWYLFYLLLLISLARYCFVLRRRDSVCWSVKV